MQLQISKRRCISAIILLTGVSLAALLLASGPLQATQGAAQSEEPIPAYHSQPPTAALPDTLDPAQFDNPVVKNAYALSAKIRKVLYQQPCYCHCDRAHGHTALLDCFTSTHGSMCNVCLAEALYSYEQTRKGKTPAQIRAGIEAGDWQHIDGKKYQTYPAQP